MRPYCKTGIIPLPLSPRQEKIPSCTVWDQDSFLNATEGKVLTPQEREELFALIIKYLETHNAHLDQDDEHWEYVFMTYRAPDESTL